MLGLEEQAREHHAKRLQCDGYPCEKWQVESGHQAEDGDHRREEGNAHQVSVRVQGCGLRLHGGVLLVEGLGSSRGSAGLGHHVNVGGCDQGGIHAFGGCTTGHVSQDVLMLCTLTGQQVAQHRGREV